MGVRFFNSRLIASILVFILFSTTSSVFAQISQDDAGTGKDAPSCICDDYSDFLLDINSTYSGTIGPNYNSEFDNPDTKDLFFYPSVPGGLYEFKFEITTVDHPLQTSMISVQLRNFSGLDGIIFHKYLENDPIQLAVPVPIIDTTFLVLELDYEIKGLSYDFSLNLVSNDIGTYLPNDAGTERDSSIDRPVLIDLNQTYSGDVGIGSINNNGFLDTIDVYEVNLDQPGWLYVVMDFPNSLQEFYTMDIVAERNLSPYYSTSDALLHLYRSEYDSPQKQVYLNASLPEAGTYYFVHEPVTEYGTPYNFKMQFAPDQINYHSDADLEKDAPSTYIETPEIPLNSTFSGHIGPGYFDRSLKMDGEDTYRFTSKYSGNFHISVQTYREQIKTNLPYTTLNSMQLNFLKFDTNLGYFKTIESVSDHPDRPATIDLSFDPGEYMIEIIAYDKLSYQVNLQTIIDPANYTTYENTTEVVDSKILLTGFTPLPYSISIIFWAIVLRRKRIDPLT